MPCTSISRRDPSIDMCNAPGSWYVWFESYEHVHGPVYVTHQSRVRVLVCSARKRKSKTFSAIVNLSGKTCSWLGYYIYTRLATVKERSVDLYRVKNMAEQKVWAKTFCKLDFTEAYCHDSASRLVVLSLG